jgi:hypothetical protein
MRSIGLRDVAVSMYRAGIESLRIEGDRVVPTYARWTTPDCAAVYLVFKTFSQNPSVG